MLIRKAGESTWHSPPVTAYANEQAIQTIVERSPDLLPGSTGSGMVVVSQLAIPETGYIDVVAVDADGGVTVIECKLEKNPEIRRHVVGQVFAYASGLWGLSYETFDQAFSAKYGASLTSAVSVIAPAGWDEESFRASVSMNLADGRFRLVFAVDRITDELSRIVRYLNQHTNPDLQVLALELGYVADEGVEILLPVVYGRESVESKPTSKGRRWDEAGVFSALAACCSPAGVAVARRLYDFAAAHGARFGWGVGVLPSVTARLPLGGKPVSALGFYEWPAGTGTVAINFEYIAGTVPDELLRRFADRLRGIPGVQERFAGLEQADFRKRPSLPLDQVVAQPDAVEQIEAAFDELLQYESPQQ